MNDDELGTALRLALAPPEVTPDRYAGQKIRRRVADRRHARTRALTSAATALVVIAMLGGLVGLLSTGGGGDDAAGGSGGAADGARSEAASTAAVTLATPLEVVEVASQAPGPCSGGTPGAVPLAAGRDCLTVVRPAVLTIRQVADVRLVPPSPETGTMTTIQVRLLSEEAAALRAYTRTHVGTRVAFVVGGEAVSAPEILGPVESPIELGVDGAPGPQAVFRSLTGG